jgi:hypothetical protein
MTMYESASNYQSMIVGGRNRPNKPSLLGTLRETRLSVTSATLASKSMRSKLGHNSEYRNISALMTAGKSFPVGFARWEPKRRITSSWIAQAPGHCYTTGRSNGGLIFPKLGKSC